MATNDNSLGFMALAQAMEAQANRPLKTSQITTTTEVPLELNDMRMRRDTIGQARQNLANALSGRTRTGYALANTLTQLPQTQGYGSWAGNLARMFGLGATARANANMANAERDYEASRTDLADALMYDKAMGSRQTAVSDIGYAGGGAGLGAGGSFGGVGKQQAQYETSNETLSDLYKTIVANPITFSTIGGVNQTEEARAIRRAVEGRGIETLGHNEFQYLQSLMPRGFATALNTAKEQEMMRPYTTMFSEGAGSAKKAAIKNMVSSIYDFYANEAKRQGIQMPISRQDYINSRLEGGRVLNPEFYTGESTEMYMPQEESDTNRGATSTRKKAADAVQSIADFMKGTV